MPRKSPARLAVDQVIADGDWHDREELIAAAMAVIPPAVAYRRAEVNRTRKTTGLRSRGGRDDAVRAGSRDLARRLIDEAVRRGSIERDGSRYRVALK